MRVSPDHLELPVGDTATLEATVRDGEGNVVENVDVDWFSRDEDIARMSDAGVVEARRLQRTRILAVVANDTGRVTVVGSPSTSDLTTSIDSTQLTLLRDSADRAEGIYRFEVVGDTAGPALRRDRGG